MKLLLNKEQFESLTEEQQIELIIKSSGLSKEEIVKLLLK